MRKAPNLKPEGAIKPSPPPSPPAPGYPNAEAVDKSYLHRPSRNHVPFDLRTEKGSDGKWYLVFGTMGEAVRDVRCVVTCRKPFVEPEVSDISDVIDAMLDRLCWCSECRADLLINLLHLKDFAVLGSTAAYRYCYKKELRK